MSKDVYFGVYNYVFCKAGLTEYKTEIITEMLCSFYTQL